MADSLEYIGVISRTHGLNGAVVLTDMTGVEVSLNPGDTVSIGYSKEFTREYSVSEFRQTKQRSTLLLNGLASADAVSVYIDHAVYVSPDKLQVDPSNRFSISEIEGCAVFLENGDEIGVVKEIWLLPANDVWVVEMPNGKTFPLPVIESVVKEIDLTHRRIKIEMMDGLLDLDGPQTKGPDDE